MKLKEIFLESYQLELAGSTALAKLLSSNGDLRFPFGDLIASAAERGPKLSALDIFLLPVVLAH